MGHPAARRRSLVVGPPCRYIGVGVLVPRHARLPGRATTLWCVSRKIRHESIPRCRSWVLQSNRALKALSAGNSIPLYVWDDDRLGPPLLRLGEFRELAEVLRMGVLGSNLSIDSVDSDQTSGFFAGSVGRTCTCSRNAIGNVTD